MKAVFQLIFSLLWFLGTTGDGLGTLSRTNEKGQVFTFTHDARHRIKTETLPNQNVRTYQYNAVGKILAVTETLEPGRANVAYTYDGLNRVLSETSHGVTHHFTYDLVGNRLQTAVGHSGRVIETTYDATGKILTLTEQGRTTQYEYDLAGNKVVTAFSNGQQVVSTFDALNRVKTQVATANGAPLQSFRYTHDPVGNVTLMEETYAMAGVGNRTVSLEYDRVHRLTAEVIVPVTSGPLQSTTYAYDAAHNRIRKQITGDKAGNAISTYNALNQLTGFSDSVTGLSATFAYDLNGNRTRRTGSDGQDTRYSYDAQNRLHAVTELGKERKIDILGPNGLKAEATYTVDGDYQYGYDYRTRRIAQSEDGIKTDFVFLGGTSITEFEGAGNDQAPVRAAGAAPTVEYIRGSDLGGGIGGILYSLREGQPSFTWYNHRGDVTAKTNTSGTLTYQAAYEAFGTRTAEQGETKDRQRANTREETAWGGLYENQRWRDLETGTYLSRDPAGFVDGPNLYAYVRQNPWTKVDPEGLSPKKITKRPHRKKLPELIVDSQVGPITEAGEEAAWATKAYKDSGDSTAAAFTKGAVVGTSRLVGTTDLAEGINKEAIWFDQNGFNTAPLSPAESQKKIVEGTLKITATSLTIGMGAPLARGSTPASLPTANSVVPQVLRNQVAGNAARDAIAASRPGSLIEQNFRVTGGLRRVDVLDGATAIESKVGRTSLTRDVRRELARDVKLLRSGQVDSVEWHFAPSATTGRSGPTGPLRAKLDKFGIPSVE